MTPDRKGRQQRRTTAQAAAKLGISPQMLRAYARRGGHLTPAPTLEGGDWVFAAGTRLRRALRTGRPKKAVFRTAKR